MDSEVNEFLEKSVDDYVPFKSVLKTHGLTFQESLRKSKEYYWSFRGLLRHCNIDTTSKESIYFDICKLAEKSPTNDLLKLYCMVLTDTGFLMDNKNPMRTNQQNILAWLEQSKKFKKAYQYIKSQSVFENRLQKIVASLNNLDIIGKNVSFEPVEVTQLISQYDIYYKYRNSNILLNNIENLIEILNSNDDFREISAYVCFAILTRKQSYISTHSGYTPNLKTIFKYEQYQIDIDNGKNFKNYLEYLKLYVELCEYYSKYHGIDNKLSDYCFLKYSNLSDWYYSNNGVYDVGVPVPFLDAIRKYLDGNIILDFSQSDITENPVAEKMLLNTIYNYPDLFKEFVSARINSQDTSNTIEKLYNLSQIDGKYPNSKNLAELVLISEMFMDIENLFIITAKNFIK